MSANCKTCCKAILDSEHFVKCCKCSYTFHAACVDLTANEIDYLSDAKEPWLCSLCSLRKGRALRSNSTSSSSSAASKSHNEPATAEQVNQLILSMKSMASDILSLKSMATDIAEIKNSQMDIRAELQRVNCALQTHSEAIEKHSSAISKCEVVLREQSAEVSACQFSIDELKSSYTDVKDRVDTLQSGVQYLRSRAEASVDLTSGDAPAFSAPASSVDTIGTLQRAHNVIIVGLPESPDEERNIRNLVDVVVPDSSQYIISCSRLGASVTNSVKPRLLKTTFSNVITPRTILRNKTKLALSDFKNVSLRDDKSPQELRLLSSLRVQLKDRKATGEQDITIKYVKGTPAIVHVPPKK